MHGTSPDGGLVDKAKEFLGELGREWVPTEIVTPPLPAGRLPEIDALVHTLVRLGAECTRTGLLNGFGLHLNPSLGPADLGAAPILAVLQSYLLDAPALRVAIDVDPVRSLLPFVEPFPPAYVDHTLDPDYRPTMSVLIDDYLRFNPTRNRELDLLPLFAEIDRDRVQRAVSDPRVSARPTFHWRLPNADLEDPLWTVAGQWARWLGVEERSLDRDALAAALGDAMGESAMGRAMDWINDQTASLGRHLDGHEGEDARLDAEDYALLLRAYQLRVGPLENGATKRPIKHAHIVLDEVQDFSPVEVQVLLDTCDNNQSVTLAGDVRQHIS